MHTTMMKEFTVPNKHDFTNPNIQTGTVIGTQTTSQHTVPAILPQRFNSTSEPSSRSIVRPELNSVSKPKTK